MTFSDAVFLGVLRVNKWWYYHSFNMLVSVPVNPRFLSPIKAWYMSATLDSAVIAADNSFSALPGDSFKINKIIKFTYHTFAIKAQAIFKIFFVCCVPTHQFQNGEGGRSFFFF